MAWRRKNANIIKNGAALPASTDLAVVCLDDTGKPYRFTGAMDVDGRIIFYVPEEVAVGQGAAFTITAPGCVPYRNRFVTPIALPGQEADEELDYTIVLVEGINSFRKRPVAIARGPLPPFEADSTDPNTGAFLPVAKQMTHTPPPIGTLWYFRENFCGVRVPNLPAVAGGGADPDLVLSWFLDRYSAPTQDRILRTHGERGYDRFTLSWPDSRDGAGQSIADYVATSQRVQAAGLFVSHHFFSKSYDGFNPDPSKVFPVIDALLAAGVLDIATIAWEMNFLWDPAQAQQAIDAIVARLPAKVPRYVHFQPGYAHYALPGEPGGNFWLRNVGKLTGLKYQVDPDWSAGMMNARTNDVLVRLIAGGVWKLPQTFDVVNWESTAQNQFFGTVDEDHGDLRGLELLCTTGPMHPAGFGNGARYSDGGVI